MSTETLLRQAVKGALAVGAAGGMVGAGAALAQVPVPAAAPATTANATQLSEITVTGSHIPRTAIATAQPVVTINRQEIESSGFTTVGQLLQSMTSAGPSLNVNYNNGGNGSVYINLHNLGAQRVLVLVNGQRWISGLNGAVDLSTIPAGVIQRVEILLDGASAIYGSEAISGVINIITVKNFNGARASAYMGMYDAHSDGGGWDGKLQRYNFLVGTSGDRSAVLLGAGYYKQEEIWAGDRTISKEPFFGSGASGGSASGPHGFFLFGTPDGVPAAPPNSPFNYGPGDYPDIPACGASASAFGGPGCSVAGPLFGPNANPHPLNASDRYNYATLNYLRTPSERWYLYSQGHYDISNNVSFHFLTAYNQRSADTVLAPNPWVLGAAGYTAGGLPIGVSAANPYNPFGIDLVPAVGFSPSIADSWCSKFGSNPAGGCTAQTGLLYEIAFRPINAPVRDFQYTKRTFYFNGGFSGYWMMFGNQWTWNADYIFSNQNDEKITTGLASTKAIQQHLSPSCTGTSPTSDCVALNMFGGAAAQTPSQIAPLLFVAHSITTQDMRDYNANIGGSFFNGWYAGPWGLAVGYEYNELDGSFSPDAFVSSGNTVGNAAKPTGGRENTNAEYFELSIPLASDVPGAQELSLDIANRWSQFHWNGIGANFNIANQTVTTAPVEGRAHTSTGRVSLKWKPVDQLLIRAAWSQAFRIPSISELFGGIGDNYPAVSDPCAPPPFGGLPSAGAPLPGGCNGVTHVQNSGQIVSTIGGNPALQPESAITRTLGFVYSPTWAPGLDFSADYYKVELEQIIGRQGAQYYLNQCYLRGNSTACGHLFVRGPSIIRIVDLNLNAGSDTIRGYDLNFDYRLPVTPIGQFSLGAGANFLLSDVNCNAIGQCFNSAGSGSGFGGEPKHRYNFSLDWTLGPWAAAWNVYVIGPMWEDCAAGTGTPEDCSNPFKVNKYHPGGQNHLGSTIYHDIQASYTLSSWNTTFTLGCLNVFDKAPPIARTAFANSFFPMYRIPGRFFYGRVSVNF